MDRQLGQDAPPPESLHKYVRGPGNSTEVSGCSSSSLGGSVVMQAAARRAVGALFVGGTLRYDMILVDTLLLLLLLDISYS